MAVYYREKLSEDGCKLHKVRRKIAVYNTDKSGITVIFEKWSKSDNIKSYKMGKTVVKATEAKRNLLYFVKNEKKSFRIEYTILWWKDEREWLYKADETVCIQLSEKWRENGSCPVLRQG